MSTGRTENAGSTPSPLAAVDALLDDVATWTTGNASALWLLVAASLVADTSLTVYGLELGLTERNPVAVDLIETVGVVPALLSLKAVAVGVGVAGWAVLPPDYRGLVPASLAVPWTLASVLNVVAVGSALLF
jgi:hypothetical protein